MMCRLISAVFIIFGLATLRSASAYKWVALKSGDPIPKNAIKLQERGDTYIGRLNYYNVILPAEVTSKGANAYFLSKLIEKDEFEVFVATEHCEWEEYPETMEKVVRAGTAWDGEPIYVARGTDGEIYHILSVYLTSKKIESWPGYWSRNGNLVCDVHNEWVDASFENIPNNTIKNRDTAIARLLGPSSFVPGQVTPVKKTAQAEYNGYQLTSSRYQVLVGDSKEYSWKEVTEDLIPDYAVVVGESEKEELIYVMRTLWSVTSCVFSELRKQYFKNEILVKNVK